MVLKRLLGEILTDMGLVTKEQLDRALIRQGEIFTERTLQARSEMTPPFTEAGVIPYPEKAPMLGIILNYMGFATLEDISKALEEQRLREERLREEAKARRERAERERFLNEYIHFELDKSRLLPEAKEILKRKAGWLTAHPNASVTIEGHCDERGTYEGNMALGARRARRVKSYLVYLEIAPERLTAVSYGADVPLEPGQDEKAWAKNRRAEFVIE